MIIIPSSKKKVIFSTTIKMNYMSYNLYLFRFGI